MTHHRHRVLLLVLSCSLLWSAAARAVLIPTEIKTASPLAGNATQLIASKVGGEVAKLAAPATLSVARKNLIDEADTTQNSASDAYQAAYATAIDNALKTIVLDKSKGEAERLNAAIVIGNVAKVVSRNQKGAIFGKTAQAMMKDSSWPIVYWGVKIARYALADDVMANKNATLAPLIVQAVQANPTRGEIVEEAYQALSLEPVSKGDPNFGADITMTLTPLLNLINWRTSQYATAAPVDPTAEIAPTTMLPVNAYDALDKSGQLKTVLKSLGDLVSAQLTTISATAPTPDADLVAGAQGVGNALSAFGEKMNNDPLRLAGNAIWKMENNAPSTKVDKLRTDLQQALAPVAQ